MIPREIAREIDELRREIRLHGGGTVRQAVAGVGGDDYRLLVPTDDIEAGESALCDVYGNSGDTLGAETPVMDGAEVLQQWGKNCAQSATIEAGTRCDKILRPWGRNAAPVGTADPAMDLYELVPTDCEPFITTT